MMRDRLVTGTLLVVLAGCSVAAPPATTPETGVEVPDEWSAETGDLVGSPDPMWWNAFGDERLTALVQEALESNRDLLAAAARVRQAEATARIAGADLEPQVGVGLNGSRQKQNFVGFPIPGAEDRVLSTVYSRYGVSMDVSWEIDLWGRLGAQAREGMANFQASRADLAGARLSIAGQAAKAWFALGEARLQLELAERTVETFRRSTGQTRSRFERGIRPSLDVRLALAQLAAARASIDARRQQLDATQRQLEILVGRYPAAALAAPEDLLPVPERVPAGLPAALVSRRPDLAAAERRLVAADQRLKSARASLYPRLALTASGGTSSAALGDLVNGDFSVWSLVGNLTAPLFQGGRLRAGVDLAEAGVDVNLANYVSAVLGAYAEVETALAAERFLADRTASLDEAAEQSIAAERLANDRYRAGLSGYITVLEAQRRSIEAQGALITARRVQLDNRVDLYLALGGGFDADTITDDTTLTTADTPEESAR